MNTSWEEFRTRAIILLIVTSTSVLLYGAVESAIEVLKYLNNY